MEKAIRFRAAVTALFGFISLALAMTTIYIFQLDNNHGSMNALMLLTLLSLLFTVGHMTALIMLIRRKRKEEL